MDTALHMTGPTLPARRPADRGSRVRRAATIVTAVVASLMLGPVGQAHATQDDVPVKATPNPFEIEELPGCYGNLNATFNHDSGIHDHGRDSKGPGYYFRDGQVFQDVKNATREVFCDAD